MWGVLKNVRKIWQKMDKSWNSEQETPLDGRMDCLCPKFWVRNPAHIPHKYCSCSVLCWNIQSEGRPGAWSSVTVRIVQWGLGKHPLFFLRSGEGRIESWAGYENINMTPLCGWTLVMVFTPASVPISCLLTMFRPIQHSVLIVS